MTFSNGDGTFDEILWGDSTARHPAIVYSIETERRHGPTLDGSALFAEVVYASLVPPQPDEDTAAGDAIQFNEPLDFELTAIAPADVRRWAA